MSEHTDTKTLEELEQAAKAEFRAELDAYIERFKRGVEEAVKAQERSRECAPPTLPAPPSAPP